MRHQIEEKLRIFLKTHMPLTEECQVVYLLVEIRKILDHEEETKKYPLLRFYADWSVHTAKDRITSEIKDIMEDVYKEIKTRQEKTTFVDPDPKVIPFISMTQLRSEIDAFLAEHYLPQDLVELNTNWPSFQSLLAGILADQPINSPCAGIRKFSFKPAEPGCVIVEIEYEKSPGVFDTYRIGGAF